MPLKSGPLREKFVLTFLKYEPVSVFYAINCNCQFLQGEEEGLLFLALPKLVLAYVSTVLAVVGGGNLF